MDREGIQRGVASLGGNQEGNSNIIAGLPWLATGSYYVIQPITKSTLLHQSMEKRISGRGKWKFKTLQVSKSSL